MTDIDLIPQYFSVDQFGSSGQEWQMTETPKPNMRVQFIDARTGEVLGHDDFHDPDLAWVRDKKTGQLHLASRFGCGGPLQSWLDENPPR